MVWRENNQQTKRGLERKQSTNKKWFGEKTINCGASIKVSILEDIVKHIYSSKALVNYTTEITSVIAVYFTYASVQGFIRYA